MILSPQLLRFLSFAGASREPYWTLLIKSTLEFLSFYSPVRFKVLWDELLLPLSKLVAVLEAGWDFLIKPISEEAFKCPFFLAALFVLLTKNIFLLEEWIRNLPFSSPAAIPLYADHENNQVQIVSGARLCRCAKETRSLVQKPPLAQPGWWEKHVWGCAGVSVGHVGPENEGLELWAHVGRKLPSLSGIKPQDYLWAK